MSLYGKTFRGLLFPLYESVLRRRPTTKFFDEYGRSEALLRADLEAIQSRKLRSLLKHCSESVPYYRSLWKSLDIDVQALNSAEDLAALPVLRKSDIRSNFDQLRTESRLGPPITKSTGGSTGEPLTFEHDQESYFRRIAVMWRGYGWGNVRLGEPTIYLWGTALGSQGSANALKERLFNRLYNRRLLSAFDLSEATLRDYVSQIDRFRPESIVAYVAPLVELAKFCQRNGLKPFSPKSILTGAEPLTEVDRTLIELVFRCPVYNTYGSREFMLIAAECEQQQGLHINIDQVVVEVVDEKDNATDGRGRILITDLHNTQMPFIRYEIGDVGQLSDEYCKCGRPYPMLSFVEGRLLDVILGTNGQVVSGEFFPHFFKDFAEIRNFQVIQTDRDKLVIKVVWSASPDESLLDVIRQEIANSLGQGMEVEFESLDAIPLGPSGKHRVTMSRIQ